MGAAVSSVRGGKRLNPTWKQDLERDYNERK